MKLPKTKAEVANWCIVNALKLPIELKVSIAAKIMQHLGSKYQNEVLRLSKTNLKTCDVCGSNDIEEVPHLGEKCNYCNS